MTPRRSAAKAFLASDISHLSTAPRGNGEAQKAFGPGPQVPSTAPVLAEWSSRLSALGLGWPGRRGGMVPCSRRGAIALPGLRRPRHP